jgi:hypothetical protein
MDHQTDWIIQLEKKRQSIGFAVGMFEVAPSPFVVDGVGGHTVVVVPWKYCCFCTIISSCTFDGGANLVDMANGSLVLDGFAAILPVWVLEVSCRNI